MAPTHVLRSSFESRLQKFHLQPPSIDRSDFYLSLWSKGSLALFLLFFFRGLLEKQTVCVLGVFAASVGGGLRGVVGVVGGRQ